MISPYLINISMLVGAIISWEFMWPYIETKKGIWYAADLQENSLRGINGYKVLTVKDYDDTYCLLPTPVHGKIR